MPLRHQLTFPDTQEIILHMYHYYHSQKSIGNITATRNMVEGLKALNIYVRILDYYYTNIDYDIDMTEENILHIYENFKQVFYSIKPNHYD